MLTTDCQNQWAWPVAPKANAKLNFVDTFWVNLLLNPITPKFVYQDRKLYSIGLNKIIWWTLCISCILHEFSYFMKVPHPHCSGHCGDNYIQSALCATDHDKTGQYHPCWLRGYETLYLYLYSRLAPMTYHRLGKFEPLGTAKSTPIRYDSTQYLMYKTLFDKKNETP